MDDLELIGKLLCALLYGGAKSSKKVEHIAKSYKNCPYINLMATKDNQLYAIYFLPEEQRWWIETIGKKPRETIGLEKAEVTFVNNVYYPEKLEVRQPEKPMDISPCKSYCKNCSYYGKCTGCPATIYFKKSIKP